MRLKTMRETHAHCWKTAVDVKGFTLLEVLLAVFVFAVSVLTMISTLTFTMRAINQNQQALFAKTAVNAELEYERNLDFTNIVSRTFSIVELPEVTGTVDVVDDYLGSVGLKRITVTVPVDSARKWSLSTLATKWTTDLGNQLYSAYPPPE